MINEISSHPNSHICIGCAPGLALVKRLKATWKWALLIVCASGKTLVKRSLKIGLFVTVACVSAYDE